ncbi:MAG TPA: alpha/beta fold hydrolase [Polyangiaceae bacterium]|jgi:phospholipase/carboxylesterase|nr:alpha/beta fold hydrolase [Polyangiaceae bacterium]
MKRARIADLDVVLVGGADRDGGGTGPLVVLLHGFGAPGDDLVPLHRVMRLPRATRFAFPAAPLETNMMPGYDSRAWWHIDMMRLQDAIARGDMRDLSTEVPEGLDEARAKMDAFLTQIRKELAPSKLVLGGFSQGSMLSVDVALRTSQSVDALVILSGTLLAQDEWVPKMSALRGKPIFQSHGTHDPILPYALAERLKTALVTAGADVTFVPFRGQHEIPPPVLESLVTFLDGVLTK